MPNTATEMISAEEPNRSKKKRRVQASAAATPTPTRKASKTKRTKKRLADKPKGLEKLYLYQAAVQCPEADLDFIEKTYKKRNGRPLRHIREDFCGSAQLACQWAGRGEGRTVLGLDLDRDTLAWAREKNVAALDESVKGNIRLEEKDVRTLTAPTELILGLNFSYWIFHDRETLRGYFEAARRSLQEGGMLVLDTFGGTEAMCEARDVKKIAASTAPDGTRIPAFTYIWEQERFNPINHAFTCHIGFRMNGWKKDRAFSYDWRFWTIAEVREVLFEAGFKAVEVYTDEWDAEAEDTDGVFRLRNKFDHDGVWVGYILGIR